MKKSNQRRLKRRINSLSTHTYVGILTDSSSFTLVAIYMRANKERYRKMKQEHIEADEGIKCEKSNNLISSPGLCPSPPKLLKKKGMEPVLLFSGFPFFFFLQASFSLDSNEGILVSRL